VETLRVIRPKCLDSGQDKGTAAAAQDALTISRDYSHQAV
jgi:hypothetical protein